MAEVSRILTEEDAKRLQKLFIDDKDIKEFREFISEKLTSQKDWRAFGHQDIFTKLNFYKGYLEKLQAVRNKVSCSTIEEVIKILYAMGYTRKRICYLLWEFGFDHDNIHIINLHIRRNKFYLERERIEFMELMEQTKETVFQKCRIEVQKAEEDSVRIYIDHVNLINKELATLDPTIEFTKCRRLRKDLAEYMDILNRVHGINDIRKWTLEVEARKQLMQEQARLHSNGTGPLTPEQITNGKPAVEVEAHFMAAPKEETQSTSS